MRRNIHKCWALWFIWAFFSWPATPHIKPPMTNSLPGGGSVLALSAKQKEILCISWFISALKYLRVLGSTSHYQPNLKCFQEIIRVPSPFFSGTVGSSDELVHLFCQRDLRPSPSVLATLFIIHQPSSFNRVIANRVPLVLKNHSNCYFAFIRAQRASANIDKLEHFFQTIFGFCCFPIVLSNILFVCTHLYLYHNHFYLFTLSSLLGEGEVLYGQRQEIIKR